MSRQVALAVGEALVAVAAVILGCWCWNRGVRTSLFPPYTSSLGAQPATYYSGPWVAGAVAAVTLAGLLGVDIVRRARRR